jgi:hypothetical protein
MYNKSESILTKVKIYLKIINNLSLDIYLMDWSRRKHNQDLQIYNRNLGLDLSLEGFPVAT